MNPLNKKVKEAILEIIAKEKGKVVFTGSVSLALRGVLDREVNDIDCFTEVRYYGSEDCLDINHESSHKFWDSKGNLIECVKGRSSNGIGIDYMYRKDFPPYNEIKVDLWNGLVSIKCTTIESIREVKEDYIKRFPNLDSKHKLDIAFIDSFL